MSGNSVEMEILKNTSIITAGCQVTRGGQSLLSRLAKLLFRLILILLPYLSTVWVERASLLWLSDYQSFTILYHLIYLIVKTLKVCQPETKSQSQIANLWNITSIQSSSLLVSFLVYTYFHILYGYFYMAIIDNTYVT